MAGRLNDSRIELSLFVAVSPQHALPFMLFIVQKPILAKLVEIGEVPQIV
jgi:hypothetical protein